VRNQWFNEAQFAAYATLGRIRGGIPWTVPKLSSAPG